VARAIKRAQGPSDLVGWAHHVMAAEGKTPARHHIKLLENLADVAAGRCDRLMVLMPPGSAKSTYASRIFPAWWLLHNGGGNIVAASHTAELAAHFGRQVRNLLAEHGDGAALARDSRAAHRFATESGGEYFATGVQGPLTGRRADLALIDDPIKSFAIADSSAARAAIWDWYRSELLTRLKPGGRIVLVMTRWHEDDLGGRLAASDDGWRILRLPAIAGYNDPIGRAPGEALWPEWENLAALQRKRSSAGARVWAALYQQTPAPAEGALFMADKLVAVDSAPANLDCVRAWDLAASAATDGRDPDWTVGVKLGRAADGRSYILDIVRLRAGPNDVAQTLIATAARDGRAVRIGLPQDPGQAGKHQVAWLTQQLAGFPVEASPETGSKTVRATPVAAAIEAGTLLMQRAAWNQPFVEELRSFPTGAKDDQVDALSRGFAMLRTKAVPRAPIRIPMRIFAR
jgi:predicted phage terminase large subunit-like protein